MRSATPALNRAVLHVLGHAALERGRPLIDTWRSLTGDLSSEEAADLPTSLGLALRMLVGDTERLRLAAELAVVFDLYEVAPYLVDLVGELNDPQLAVAAASLSQNPGVEEDVVRRLRSLRVVEELSPALRAAFGLRLDPTTPVASDHLRLLRFQSWPGIDDDGYRRAPVAPLVAVATGQLPDRWSLDLMAALRERGATIRRIPAKLRRPVPPGWLGPAVPVVATSADVLTRLRQAGQRVDAGQVAVVDPNHAVGQDSVTRALSLVDDHLRRIGPARLRTLEHAASISLPTDVLAREVFTLGAFDAQEVAYLAGGKRSWVYRWAGKLDALKPHHVEGLSYWSFNHVVALRAYRYLQSQTTRTIPPRVIEGLADLSGRPVGTEIAVSSDAKVMIVAGDEIQELGAGQGMFPAVARIDETFRPFKLGSGVVTPGLLEPSDNTRVHPTVLGGTPAVAGHRLSCTVLARLADDHSDAEVREIYELGEAQAQEAIRVGRAILALK